MASIEFITSWRWCGWWVAQKKTNEICIPNNIRLTNAQIVAQHPRYPTIQHSTPPCRTQLKRRRRSQKSLELFWGMFRWVLVTYIPQIVCLSVCPSVCLSVRLAVVQFEMSTKAYTLHMNTSNQTKEQRSSLCMTSKRVCVAYGVYQFNRATS